jgi:hypothetical protein
MARIERFRPVILPEENVQSVVILRRRQAHCRVQSQANDQTRREKINPIQGTQTFLEAVVASSDRSHRDRLDYACKVRHGRFSPIRTLFVGDMLALTGAGSVGGRSIYDLLLLADHATVQLLRMRVIVASLRLRPP